MCASIINAQGGGKKGGKKATEGDRKEAVVEEKVPLLAEGADGDGDEEEAQGRTVELAPLGDKAVYSPQSDQATTEPGRTLSLNPPANN